MIIKTRYNGPQMPTTYAVAMTAAASGSNGITVADADDIDFGTGDFFLHWEGSLPDWTPSANTPLILKWAPNTGYFLAISAAGIINVRINGVSYNATSAISDIANDIKKITCSIVRGTASSAGVVNFYANGNAVGSPVSISLGAPATVSSANDFYCSGNATTRTASSTISCIVGNFAPTAAEVLDLCTNGIPASWKWGSQAAVYAQDTSAGADSWTGTSVTVAGNVDGIGGRDNVLSATCTTTGTSDTPRITRASVIPSAGKKASITFNLYRPAANTAVVGFRVTDSAGAGIFSGSVNNIITTAADTWQSFTISGTVVSTATTTIRLYPINAAGVRQQVTGEVLYLDATTSTQHGVTMALLPDTIPTSSATTWSDTSGNTGGGTLPAAGATKVTIRK